MQPVPHQRPLFYQCLRRVRLFFARQNLPVSVDALAQRAEWVISQIRVAPELRPADCEPDPVTGISDSYIDRIIHAAACECPRVTALRMGGRQAWEVLLDFIHARAYTYVRKYDIRGLDRDILVDDLAQSCALTIWRRLNQYRHDAPFEAWASKVISTEVRRICLARGFVRHQNSLSIDQPVRNQRTGEWTLIELRAEPPDSDQNELAIAIQSHPAWTRLNALQREVCLRRARGESQRVVASALGKTLTQIQSIQSRARQKFQEQPRYQ